MRKKIYEAPESEPIKFDMNDILTAGSTESYDGPTHGNEEGKDPYEDGKG